MNYIPCTGLAVLHEGDNVISRKEHERYASRSQQTGERVTVVVNITDTRASEEIARIQAEIIEAIEQFAR